MDDFDSPSDGVRSSQEVAYRALALFAVTGLALGAPRDDVLNWLESNHLRRFLTSREVQFVDNVNPSVKQNIDFSWQSERLIVLLWALGLVEVLPGADEQCDTSVFHCFPPFTEQSVDQFINHATLRLNDELMAEADRTLNLHWLARDAHLHQRTPKELVNIEVVQERHHALNWVTGYDGLDWDEVTTDT